MKAGGKYRGSRQVDQQLDASLEAASLSIEPEARGNTKKALLESVGYGVMDAVAYQTFDDSPLPPKLRPSTHVRVAEGVHSFAQEFLGFPPEEGVSSFSESAPVMGAPPPMHSASDTGEQPSQPYPKLPGVGARMVVVRLGNGELLFHSPTAPTVELLDMLKESFPAVGPTSKVHLVSPSWSPEHWVFVKFWKEIFPSAEVWAVLGPHRRFMGVEVDHDLVHSCAVPEALGGEIEIAVLEGVPVVREALLLHRPTGTLLSADLLMAMDKKSTGDLGRDMSGLPETATSFPPPADFASSSPAYGAPRRAAEVAATKKKRGRGRRFRWRLLDKTASLLDMSTLAVFAPFKTILHAVKGNSAELSARVLSWDVKIFVGSHGQSPLQGPELMGMLHTALARYTTVPTAHKDKKRLGNRLRAMLPGRHGLKVDTDGGRREETSTYPSQQTGSVTESPHPVQSGVWFGDGDSAGGDRAASGSAVSPCVEDTPQRPPSLPSVVDQVVTPQEVATVAPPVLPPLASSPQRQQQPSSLPLENTFEMKVSAVNATQGILDESAGSIGTLDKGETVALETRTFAASTATLAEGQSLPTSSSAVPNTTLSQETETGYPGKETTPTSGGGGLDLGAVFAKWSMPTAPRHPDAPGAENKHNKKAHSPYAADESDPSTEDKPPTSNASVASAAEIEARARRYVDDKAKASQQALEGGTATPSSASATNKSVDASVRLSGAVSVDVGCDEQESGEALVENTVSKDGPAEGRQFKPDTFSGDPFVQDPNVRYDERPAGSIDDSHDPFEEPFFPFKDDGPPGGQLPK